MLSESFSRISLIATYNPFDALYHFYKCIFRCKKNILFFRMTYFYSFSPSSFIHLLEWFCKWLCVSFKLFRIFIYVGQKSINHSSFKKKDREEWKNYCGMICMIRLKYASMWKHLFFLCFFLRRSIINIMFLSWTITVM